MKRTFHALFLVLSMMPDVGRAELSAKDAEAIVNRVVDMYRAEIARTHQLPIEIRFLWNQQIMQATGGRIADRVEFTLYGGLLKGSMTQDVFTAVFCHEMGHVLGGYPEVRDYPFPMNSVEGQADYFATSKCLRRVFARDDNDQKLRGISLPPSISKSCASVYANARDQSLCRRVLWSGLQSLRLIYHDENLTFDTPDLSVANETNMGYPSRQCRLDTFKAGALCTVPSSTGFRFEHTDQALGACSRANPRQKIGARPRCWFVD